MPNDNQSGLELPRNVDSENALERFRSRMMRGLFHPRSLKTADWRPPRLLFIPARLVTAKARTNWTAESGTKTGSRIKWAPISGQHRGTHEGLAFLVCDKKWRRHEKRLLSQLAAAVPGKRRPEAAGMAATTMGEAEIEKRAREIVQEAEKKSCAQMIPGSSKRRLSVNTTIEELTVEPLLIPVWEVEVADGGTVHRGWVNATTGRVHANGPTSIKRVLAVFGLALGLPAAGLLTLIGGIYGGLALERVEQQRIAEEQQRLAEEQWGTSKEELMAAVAAGEEALARREPAIARGEVGPITKPLTRMKKHLRDPDFMALWDRYEVVDTEIDRIEAIRRGLEVTKAVVNDADKCTNSDELRKAWKDLRRVRTTDPERSEAVRLARSLERCRVKTGRQLNAALKEVMMAGRVAIAEKMERLFLDDGMDVRVQVQGSNKDRLKLTWVLFGRATIHQVTNGGSMTKGSFLRNLEDAGFRRVTFSDGFGESTWYDLEPEPLDMLATEGLKEPFTLSE